MIVVAFYTPEYAGEIDNLRKSCEKFNIPLKTTAYPSRNSWEENCSMKSEFLMEMLNNYRDNLFYVDADGEFRRPPNWQELESNHLMGVVYHQWFYGTKLVNELLSGSIYLPNNDLTKETVQLWIDEQKKDRSIWDQKTLQKVVENSIENRAFVMSKKWCYVEDYMKVSDPIIQHWQASRRLKQPINESNIKS